MHISIMLVFWSLVRNSVVLAVYFLFSVTCFFTVHEHFVEELNYAMPRGPLAEWPGVSDAISLAFNQVITGTATPEDAAAQAQETIDGIVK